MKALSRCNTCFLGSKCVLLVPVDRVYIGLLVSLHVSIRAFHSKKVRGKSPNTSKHCYIRVFVAKNVTFSSIMVIRTFRVLGAVM